jgi:hypothetical protein
MYTLVAVEATSFGIFIIRASDRRTHQQVRDCSPRGPARRDVHALSLYLQPKSSISGVDGVRLRPMAQMLQFTVEASWRVSIQQLRCAAEFRQIPEKRAKDGLGKGSAPRTLAHAALTLSNAYGCIAVTPLFSVEFARLAYTPSHTAA